jgi:shikimate 5-dehydrogenase
MLTLKEWMEIVDYKITEGGDYGWDCYGSNSHQLSAWNGVHGSGGWSANIVFSTKSQKVYEVEVCDYTNDRAYRLINPKYKAKHAAEATERGVLGNQAWDDVNYTDLDVEEDFLEKLTAIVNGEEYDTRVSIPVDFTDEELLKYMKLAHERDMTFNALVEEALREAINAAKESGILKDNESSDDYSEI